MKTNFNKTNKKYLLKVLKRFHSQISIDKNKCWNWNGDSQKNGYGKFASHNKQWVTHRWSWIFHNGSIPIGLLCCHKCDNKKCANPDHLFIGTQKDNIQDALKKKRIPVGENRYGAKVTELQAIKILKDPRKCREIAKIYSVAWSTIDCIKKRKKWKHLSC